MKLFNDKKAACKTCGREDYEKEMFYFGDIDKDFVYIYCPKCYKEMCLKKRDYGTK